MEPNRDNDAKEIPALQKLTDALKRTQSATVFVPHTVDEAVLRAAREHLAPAKTPRRNPLMAWLRWPALAAACLVACALVYRFTRPNPPSYAREDVNHDGRVDILDALQLAQQVRSGQKPVPALDLNGDGVVDQRDAEVITTYAVKLEKGGRS